MYRFPSPLVSIVISFLSTGANAFSPSPSQPQNKLSEAKGVDDRRSFLSTIIGGTAAAANIPFVLSSNPLIANAEDDASLSLFQDSNVGFQINVPSTWKKSEQTLPDRRRLVLFVDNDGGESGNDNAGKGLDDILFVAYTTVRDDFTSLGSFGSVEQVGQATILPKGALAGQDTENKMIQAESKKNAYYFDYTTKTPDQPQRHFRTIFTLINGGTGGAGSMLVTITAQTLESRYDAEMKTKFDQIIDSYRKI